jgi:acyl-CoA reductase-like NAD-dependent aldehyde dehydrogenase
LAAADETRLNEQRCRIVPRRLAGEAMSTKKAILSPFDQSWVGEVDLQSPAEISHCLDTAANAFPGWSALSFGRRSDLLEGAARLCLEQQDEIATLLTRESGKVLRQARFEAQFSAALLKGNAELARRMAGELLPTQAAEGTAHDIAWVQRVPLGTVAAILPFNFPVELLIEKAAAALAMGNTVIVKPPEQNPLAVLRVIELFHAAGIPREVLQAVNGGAEAGEQLASSPSVAAISLTGSTRAGLAAVRNAAPKLRRLHLELGGNDAALILEDADLDLVVSEVVPGRILMNGQSCAANKRLIVHRRHAEELTARLAAVVEQLKVGDPLDTATEVGPVINQAAAMRVIEQVGRAVGEGASLVSGELGRRGALVDPHLLGDVPATAQIAIDDEIFGPVFAVIPVATDRDALRVANQSSYGLNACVFSRDVSRALAFAEKLQAGGVVINGSGNYRPPIVPFGGVKLSGLGREGLGFTLDEMSQQKFTVLRRIRRPELCQ